MSLLLLFGGGPLPLSPPPPPPPPPPAPALKRAIFGFPRVSSFFSLSGGLWNASYPQSNLQILPLSDVARTIDRENAHTVIIATADVPKAAGLVALARHNMSFAAKIRLRVWSEAAMINLAYDSGSVAVWPEIYAYGTLEWEDDSYWTGTYTSVETEGYSWLWWKQFHDTGIVVGAIQIDIDDTSNPAGYVQAGYLEIARPFEVTYNPDWGMGYGFRRRSQVTEAMGGALYVDRRDKPRVVKGSFKYSPRNEAMAKHFERERQLDLDQPILFIPFPDESAHQLRTVILARHTDPGLAALTVNGFDTVPFALEEIIG